MPLRAIRTSMPRVCTHRRSSAVSYALSACSFAGLHRRGPRRDRTAGKAFTSGLSTSASLVLAAEIVLQSG
jgi:hypothetical protein